MQLAHSGAKNKNCRTGYQCDKLHLELLSRLELPNLFLTKEVLYLLSYNSPSCVHS